MAYLGEEIKKLGFGLMRLPKDGEVSDVEQVKEMVDRFLAAGFTYFDTAWAYGDSEETIRKALVERYPRESYQLATKCAAWIGAESAEEAQKQLDISLERTGAGYFDFYLLHNVGDFRTPVFEKFGMWDWIRAQKEAGKIRHWGFSFHSTPQELEAVLTANPDAEFVQLQINYADWDNPAVRSRECWEVCRKHGKPVVIMEPVKGGQLANPPEDVAKVLKDADPEASAASWAVRFAADLEGIITVLSGMSDIAQMEDNISYMKDFTGLTEEQKAVIGQARDTLAKYPVIPCTSCNYCAKVCPMDIGVSGSFTAMNYLTIYGDREYAGFQEGWLVERHGHKHANECVKCGACEQVCPQHIQIRDELVRVCEAFGLKS